MIKVPIYKEEYEIKVLRMVARTDISLDDRIKLLWSYHQKYVIIPYPKDM